MGSNSIGRKPSLLASATGDSGGGTVAVGSNTASSTSSTSMRDFSSVGTGAVDKCVNIRQLQYTSVLH